MSTPRPRVLMAVRALATACACLICALLLAAPAAAAPLTSLTATGEGQSGHGPELAVDGDASTYWQSPSSSSMQDYRRFIDIDLNGLYSLSSVTVRTVPGAYCHYEVYASEDGSAYDKVAYKSSDDMASDAGETYDVSGTRARYLRLNVSYCSTSQAVSVAEVSADGDLISTDPAEKQAISVDAFEDSAWGAEWERVETDADYAHQKTVDELYDMVSRVLGDEWRDDFVFELRDKMDGKDVFEVSDNGDGRILIRGNDGVSLASGWNYYLRTYAKVDYNPLFGSNLDMPAELPVVGKKVVKFTNYEYRYALNFCTYSYTMAFWDWDDYEPFLDWCAMNGVNIMLDIVGQEEVLRETLTQYGYTDDEVKEYLTGPAYYAWFYMQNMTSLGGPLPDSWFSQRVELGRQIHDRMQTFGMTPVIQGFGGQVPSDFEEKNPDSVAASSGTWSGFDRPYMLKTYLTGDDTAAGKQDYFQLVGTSFYEAQERVFGNVSNYYAVDPFHEGGTIPDGFDIVDIYRTVQEKMLSYDENAIWVMQQWQNGINETKLSGLADKSQALVLDLQSDLRSQASPMENQGVPWVWNMLHNFGGRMGLDGVPEVLATQIPETYNSSQYMTGIGITPEAIENSPMVYELLFDMTWEQDPIDYRAWAQDYAERRYGGTDEKIQEAWDILLDTVYKHEDGEYYQGASESIINARPTDGAINAASTWGHSDIDYDKEELERAAQLFADSYDTYKDSPAFRYDFVDVTRQVLANASQEYQPLMAQAYKDGDLDRFKELSSTFLDLVKTQDELLGTCDEFLLGTWIEDARTMLDGMDDWTCDQFELNARMLVTTWGLEKNSSLVDYSNRQWAGLTGDYYYGRWELYVQDRIAALEAGTSAADRDWFDYGWEWANRKSDEGSSFATTASDADQKELAQRALDRYSVGAMDEGTDASSQLVNLALGMDVIDADTNAAVPNLTDGNTDTGWTETGKGEAQLVLDLGRTVSLQRVGFTLQQIAADFPVAYEIDVYDGTDWVNVAKSDAQTVSSRNEIDCDVTGSKVRYTLRSTDGKDLAGVYEVSAWGISAPEADYENLALSGTATAASSERPASNGIDGDASTLWVNNGSGESWYQVDLPSAQYVDKVRLVFETSGRQFQFRVTARTEDGGTVELLDMTNNQTGLDASYEMPVGATIDQVRVEFTGAVAGSTPWPAIAELEILQERSDELALTNIAASATVTSSASKDAPEDASALVDGTGTAWVSRDGAVPAWVQLDLPAERYVQTIRLAFEEGAPDRSMQFTLTVTDAEGTTTKVYERTADDLSREQGISIDVPVNMQVKTVRMDITDARIPSTGGSAWPLVAEIEILQTPENIAPEATLGTTVAGVSDENLALLTDGSTDSALELSGAGEKAVTMDFDEPVDIQSLLLALQTASDPARFKVEYHVPGEAADAYEMLFDYTNNDRLTNRLLLSAASAVYTDGLRLTFLNDAAVRLQEVSVYRADASTGLLARTTQVRDLLGGLTFGEYAGNYRADARDALTEVLDAAQAAANASPTSVEAAEWIDKVNAALRAFYRDGFVSLDRNELYVALDDADALAATLEDLGHDDLAVEVRDARAQAAAVAEAYGTVTQGDVDAAVQALEAACAQATASLNAEERYRVALDAANAALDAAQVGSFEGQYPQAVVDALAAAIASAEQGYASAAGDADAVEALAATLAEALDTFRGAAVRIDAAEFAAVRSELEGLSEADYDKGGWSAVADALARADAIDLAAVSQADLDALTGAMDDALAGLVRLDRSALATAVAQAQALREQDYTADSWKALAAARDAARKLAAQTSVSQRELDDALSALTAAREALVQAPVNGGGTGDTGTGGTGTGGTGTGGTGTGGGSGSQGGAGAGTGSGTGGGAGGFAGAGSEGGLPGTGDAAPYVAFGVLGALALTGGAALGFSRRRR